MATGKVAPRRRRLRYWREQRKGLQVPPRPPHTLLMTLSHYGAHDMQMLGARFSVCVKP